MDRLFIEDFSGPFIVEDPANDPEHIGDFGVYIYKFPNGDTLAIYDDYTYATGKPNRETRPKYDWALWNSDVSLDEICAPDYETGLTTSNPRCIEDSTENLYTFQEALDEFFTKMEEIQTRREVSAMNEQWHFYRDERFPGDYLMDDGDLMVIYPPDSPNSLKPGTWCWGIYYGDLIEEGEKLDPNMPDNGDEGFATLDELKEALLAYPDEVDIVLHDERKWYASKNDELYARKRKANMKKQADLTMNDFAGPFIVQDGPDPNHETDTGIFIHQFSDGTTLAIYDNESYGVRNPHNGYPAISVDWVLWDETVPVDEIIVWDGHVVQEQCCIDYSKVDYLDSVEEAIDHFNEVWHHPVASCEAHKSARMENRQAGKTFYEWEDLIEYLQDDDGLALDVAPAYIDQPQKWVYAYDNDGMKYEIEVEQYSDGRFDIIGVSEPYLASRRRAQKIARIPWEIEDHITSICNIVESKMGFYPDGLFDSIKENVQEYFYGEEWGDFVASHKAVKKRVAQPVSYNWGGGGGLFFTEWMDYELSVVQAIDGSWNFDIYDIDWEDGDEPLVEGYGYYDHIDAQEAAEQALVNMVRTDGKTSARHFARLGWEEKEPYIGGYYGSDAVLTWRCLFNDNDKGFDIKATVVKEESVSNYMKCPELPENTPIYTYWIDFISDNIIDGRMIQFNMGLNYKAEKGFEDDNMALEEAEEIIREEFPYSKVSSRAGKANARNRSRKLSADAGDSRRFVYNGPAYKYKEEYGNYLGDFNMVTHAVSKKRAISNIKYRIRENMGLGQVPIVIDGSKVVEEE